MIEDWYRHHQTEDLSQFLCANHVLKGKDTSKSWLQPGAPQASWGGWGSPARALGALLLPQGPLYHSPQAAWQRSGLARRVTWQAWGRSRARERTGRRRRAGRMRARELLASQLQGRPWRRVGSRRRLRSPTAGLMSCRHAAAASGATCSGFSPCHALQVPKEKGLVSRHE